MSPMPGTRADHARPHAAGWWLTALSIALMHGLPCADPSGGATTCSGDADLLQAADTDDAGTSEHAHAHGRPKLTTKSAADLEVNASDPDLVAKATSIYRTHGCCVIRGLNREWVGPITEAIKRTAAQSKRLEQAGKLERLQEGWVTPDGTLFIPEPAELESKANR